MLRSLIATGFALFISTSAMAQNQSRPQNLPTKNTSVVIATGNTFQTVLAAPTGDPRNSLTIQNNNAADSCWITFGVGITAGNATKAKSILLLAGGSYTRYWPYTPSDEIEGTCASSSDTLYIDSQ